MAGEPDKHFILELPPGAWVKRDGSGMATDFPMWAYWLRIAHAQAGAAEHLRPTDEYIDRIADSLIARGTPDEPAEEWDEGGGNQSTQAALTAVVAAAMAVDGFYGTVVTVAPRVEAVARHSIILETLKVGFAVGPWQQRWATALKWLFKTRDYAVHHAAGPQAVVVVRCTNRAAVLGAPEALMFAPDQARRAADLAIEVVTTCLANPKTPTRDLAKHYVSITAAALRGEHVDGREP